jgi:hypothetical protein
MNAPLSDINEVNDDEAKAEATADAITEEAAEAALNVAQKKLYRRRRRRIYTLCCC